jgi:hypothetical protein
MTTIFITGNAQAAIKKEVEQIIRDGSPLNIKPIFFLSIDKAFKCQDGRPQPGGGGFHLFSPCLTSNPYEQGSL